MSGNASIGSALIRKSALAIIALGLFLTIRTLLPSSSVEAPSRPQRLMYLKSELDEKNLRTYQLILYDPPTNAKKVIYTIDDPQHIGMGSIPASHYLDHFGRAYASRASDGFLFSIFDLDGSDRAGIQGFTRIVKISPEGKTLEALRLPSADHSWAAVSADQRKLASFTPRCSWRIDDLVTKERKEIRGPIRPNGACDHGGVLIAFSRDSTKLYYVRGFGETIGYTDEEMREEAQEGAYGLRSVDLETSADRLLIPWSFRYKGQLFWYSPYVHREKRIVLISKDGDIVKVRVQVSSLATLWRSRDWAIQISIT